MPPWAANLLESLGLTLLLLSVAIGLLSLGLATVPGHPLVQRLTQLSGFLNPKILTYLTLLLIFSGVALLGLRSLWLASGAAPPPGLPVTSVTQVPAQPARMPMAPVVSRPPPAPASAPALPVEVIEPVQPTAPAQAMPRARPAPAPAAAVKTTAIQLSQPKERPPERKAHIFNARCSHLLEKVGAGEPMSETEHNEMVTQCQ